MTIAVRLRLARLAMTLAVLAFADATTARAQLSTQSPEERFQELTDLDKLSDKLAEKKKDRPPFEFFQTQVAPFDTLPYYRPNHWFSMSVSLRSNATDYDGQIRTASDLNGRPQLPLLDMPHAMSYRRDALLPKEQTVTRTLQIFETGPARRLIFELSRPGAIRPDDGFEANLLRLEPHQMIVAVLADEPSNYNAWASMLATVPTSGDRDPAAIDRLRYYRFALPQTPDRPNLAAHPLAWTTTSHLVWDGFNPETLGAGPLGQQRAILDWLHWGGQIVVVAAGPNVAPLRESFLGPYLPANPSGSGVSLTTPDLAGLSDAYRPPLPVNVIEYPYGVDPTSQAPPARPARYGPPVAIAPTSEQPLFVAGLEPRDLPGVVSYPIGDPDGHVLAVEHRVGRGRVLMLAVNPFDPALVAWPGLDTLVRRLLLRRPEETWSGGDRSAFQVLSGPQLSWVRYVARDLGAHATEVGADPELPTLAGELTPPTEPVAAWSDSASQMPIEVRSTLEQASGITIPGRSFVLKVILAYIIALVPLNWFVCRYLARRRELAWIVAPLLAFGFAFGVERGAAYDVGFDSACDEVDVLEIQGGYGRGHLTRFASLYSSGRARYEIAYPDDPSALALPMRAVERVRGEASRYSTFQSTPIPALVDFPVEPRSLAMFRAEAMVELGGGLALDGGLDSGKLINGTDLELRDAVLIDVEHDRRISLGRLAPWPRTEQELAAKAHEVVLDGDTGSVDGARVPSDATDSEASDISWADRETYLEILKTYRWTGPPEAGEFRLVAWTPGVHPGQRIEPAIDRHRGLRLVVAHLRFETPDPDATPYYDPTDPPKDDDSVMDETN